MPLLTAALRAEAWALARPRLLGAAGLILLGVATFVLAGSVSKRLADETKDPGRKRYRDFYEFYCGAEDLAAGRDIYQVPPTPPGEPRVRIGYVYPPTLAFLMRPMVDLGIGASAWIWLALNLAVFWFAALVGAREIGRRFRLPGAARPAIALLLGFVLVADKVRAQFRMQETDALMLAGFILGMSWYQRRPLAAGLVLGFTACIKYLTLLALPYFLLRREWKALGATLAGTAFWALLPAVGIGWDANLTYLERALRGLTRMIDPSAVGGDGAPVPEEGFGISIPALASRLLGDGGHDADSVAVVAVVALLFTLTCMAIYRAWGVPLLTGRGGAADRAYPLEAVVVVEWAGLVVIALAFGPGTNPRHLTLLLLPAMTGAAVLFLPRPQGRPSNGLLLCALGLLFAGLVFPPSNDGWKLDWLTHAWRDAAGPCWTTLVSYLLLLWVALSRLAPAPETLAPETLAPGNPAPHDPAPQDPPLARPASA